MKQIARAASLLLLIAVTSPPPAAWAQVPPGSAPHTSVLATGGGQALLDTSDTVFLLLDHQTGLFQTVKDIGVAELRTNAVPSALIEALAWHGGWNQKKLTPAMP